MTADKKSFCQVTNDQLLNELKTNIVGELTVDQMSWHFVVVPGQCAKRHSAKWQ